MLEKDEKMSPVLVDADCAKRTRDLARDAHAATGPKTGESIGEAMHRFAGELYPVWRSITGDGLRRSLAYIGKRIPLEIHEVASGTQVFDWTVPREWNVRDAYIKGPDGAKVVDFQKSSLHLLNYSTPIHATMSLAELRPHLFTLPEHPDWIPYRTSYYQENWGFCLAHNAMLALKEGKYEVCIDSTLADGHLSYGECYIPGKSTDEVLISCHVCHPALANDNLSGIAVGTFLAESLLGRDLHYSYRFLFMPATIGAITWLARNQESAAKIRHGLVLTCLGDRGGFHYKKSRRGDTEIDHAVAEALRHCGEPGEVRDFSPWGYDERQYCSPGFNLAVGCLSRSIWETFPEYHTSADNLGFIQPAQLAASLSLCATISEVLEKNRRCINRNPHCEPQLGRRGVWGATGGGGVAALSTACLWVLNLCDGTNTLLQIAERSGVPFAAISDAADLLSAKGLLSVL